MSEAIQQEVMRLRRELVVTQQAYSEVMQQLRDTVRDYESLVARLKEIVGGVSEHSYKPQAGMGEPRAVAPVAGVGGGDGQGAE